MSQPKVAKIVEITLWIWTAVFPINNNLLEISCDHFNPNKFCFTLKNQVDLVVTLEDILYITGLGNPTDLTCSVHKTNS